MIIPLRLYTYIGMRVLMRIFYLFLILTGLILLIDIIESLSEIQGAENAGIIDAIQLTVMRTPKIALTLTPFVFLFGAIWAFSQLGRQSEIAVMRSAGISIWGLVTPPAILALIFGILIVTIIDPLSSNLSLESQLLNNKINGKKGTLLKPLQSGIWLRQKDGQSSLIMHAERYDESSETLHEVTFWRRTIKGVFIERWDAKQAQLADKVFILKQARRTNLERVEEEVIDQQVLPSAFTLADLNEDVSRPDTMSFWALPDFIKLSRNAGLPSLRYEVRYFELITLPVRLFAMVLIAASVSMRSSRKGGNITLVIYGTLAGFLLFILSELSLATAKAHLTPVSLAAWAPTLLAVIIALNLLLHIEDG